MDAEFVQGLLGGLQKRLPVAAAATGFDGPPRAPVARASTSWGNCWIENGRRCGYGVHCSGPSQDE